MSLLATLMPPPPQRYVLQDLVSIHGFYYQFQICICWSTLYLSASFGCHIAFVNISNCVTVVRSDQQA